MGRTPPKPPRPRVFLPPGAMKRLEPELVRPEDGAPLKERFEALDHNREVFKGRCYTVGSPAWLAIAYSIAPICHLEGEAAVEYVKTLRGSLA